MHQNPYQAPATDGPPMGGYGAAAGGHYEFDDFQNQTIAKLAKRCSVWGVISFISGGLCALGVIGLFAFASQLPAEVSWMVGAGAGLLIPMALINLAIGGLYLGSGRALRAVVDTQGNDVELLMGGVAKLGKAFMIEVIVSAIAMVAGLGIGAAMASQM